ncbi:glycosyltransferase [Rhodocaloribacter litoris]|uniref:glycosyltransferase n=1 Tax=Rhodocaloribacter litoris TaxID=2558931 RepID=UPI001421529C|nr:glycosyltransferase [Rhodocaloribacter litoris]QXD16010.1 glycosyltransferase [Rhodocaloribacter litoris]
MAIFERLEAGDVGATREAIARHRARFPDDEDLPSVEAAVYLGEGDRRGAERTLAAALVRNPDHFGCLLMLGNLYLEQGHQERAARLYTRARRVAGENELQQLAPYWERLREAGFTDPVSPVKLAFIVREGLDQFLDDIPRELVADYEVRKFVVNSTSGVEEALRWGDVCWFEWCNDPLVYASRHPLAREKKIICRLHRYEAFSDYPSQVNWKTVDALIFVADYVRRLVEASVSLAVEGCIVDVIRNGVDLERYAFRERSTGYRIASVGYLRLAKNHMMMLQIMQRLVQRDPRYQLFIAGTFQDPLLEMYMHYMIREMGLERNIHFDGWQDDIASWLEDKDYFLSTSIHESFGYAIAEAMARGIKPVVHNFPFAYETWAEEMLFNTVDEAVEMITSDEYDSRLYRAFIEGHYALEKQVARIRALLARLTNGAPGVLTPRPAGPAIRVAGHT